MTTDHDPPPASIRTVLVTGGAGFIGSHTIDLLLERGYRVRVMDALLPPVHPQPTVPSYLPADVEFLRGDVRSASDWERALRDIDAVIHLAAYQDYLPDFSTFFHVNSVGTALLYETIVAHKLPIQKVVVASSQAAYGEGRYRAPDGGIVYPPSRTLDALARGDWEIRDAATGQPLTPLWTDESQVQPHNQYAISKYTQELIALNLGRRYDIPTAAMRYSITQGPRQSFSNAYSGILRIFATRLLVRQPPIVYEDGQQLRDYVWVGDVARANVLVMERPETRYEVYNVGGGRAYSVLDYAQLLARKLGVDIEPQVPGYYRFGDTRHIISAIGKLQALGWQPTLTIDQIADQYLAWIGDRVDLRDYYGEAEDRMLSLETLRKSQARAPGQPG